MGRPCFRWFGCTLISLSPSIGLYHASCLIFPIQRHNRANDDENSMLIVNDVEFRINLTSRVGGTTIKRPSVGDAGRGDQRETGFSRGCLWSPFPASCAGFLLASIALAKG